jgi:hypothetical protein
MNKSRYILPVIALAIFPSTALANAGTPLMWASMLHLVFGNAIIGLVEGLLLSWMFKCSKWKTILILITANYVSAWAGGFFIAEYLPSLADITIQNIQFWFLAFVSIAFIATLLIEFPFFWLALGSGPSKDFVVKMRRQGNRFVSPWSCRSPHGQFVTQLILTTTT